MNGIQEAEGSNPSNSTMKTDRQAVKWRPVSLPEGWDLEWGHPEHLELADPAEFEDEDEYLYLSEDLLSFKRGELLLDVGWVPHGSPSGAYHVVVVEHCDWDHPLDSYYSTDPKNVIWFIELVAKKYV